MTNIQNTPIEILLKRMKKADLKTSYAIKECLRAKEQIKKIGLTDKQKRIRQIKTGFNSW